MTVIKFPDNAEPAREFTEPEARAAASMFWVMTQYSTRLVAHWYLRKKPPSKNELHQLMSLLSWADQVGVTTATRPPGSLKDFDEVIASLQTYEAMLTEERRKGAGQ